MFYSLESNIYYAWVKTWLSYETYLHILGALYMNGIGVNYASPLVEVSKVYIYIYVRGEVFFFYPMNLNGFHWDALRLS